MQFSCWSGDLSSGTGSDLFFHCFCDIFIGAGTARFRKVVLFFFPKQNSFIFHVGKEVQL